MPDSTPRTTFNLLLTELKGRLTAGLGVPEERVFRLLRPLRRSFNVLPSVYVALRPGHAEVDRDWQDSEGRLCVAIDRDLIVSPYVNLSLDDVSSNDKITQSLLNIEDQIIDLLDIYEPELALEPIHLRGIDMETGGEEVEMAGVTPLWAASNIHFSVKYLMAVNQGLQ